MRDKNQGSIDHFGGALDKTEFGLIWVGRGLIQGELVQIDGGKSPNRTQDITRMTFQKMCELSRSSGDTAHPCLEEDVRDHQIIWGLYRALVTVTRKSHRRRCARLPSKRTYRSGPT